MAIRTASLALALLLAVGSVRSVRAAQEDVDAVPEAAGLTGRDVYERVLRNRFRTTYQVQRMISSDPGGSRQETRLKVRFRDYRGDPEAEKGVVAKILVKYTHPRDLRRTGYLIVKKEAGPDDQFIYSPGLRKVRRVNLTEETILGTELTLEDVIPRGVEESTYERQPDEELDGEPVFVVDMIPRPDVQSSYSRLRLYVDREKFLALRTRYWDARGVEIKSLDVNRAQIREVGGIWLAGESTMRNELEGTATTLVVEEVDPDPDLRDVVFSISNLQKK